LREALAREWTAAADDEEFDMVADGSSRPDLVHRNAQQGLAAARCRSRT
jgi:hypothetical protein